ncbi:MAG: hypothetical protein R6X25_16210 [Candidatus Krumholzibacteriia bacterium]
MCERRDTGRKGAWRAAVVVLVAVASLAPAAGARLVLERHSQAAATLHALAGHWRIEDHAALAELVASEGVRIAIGPVPDRENLYSPSQSFYFFKNLFQDLESEAFVVETQQDGDQGRAHAVARWRFRRSGADRTEEMRLVISLVRGPDGWAVGEIRALR